MPRIGRICRAAVACCSVASAGSAQATEPVLREILERFRSESHFPGAVLGAWRAGSPPIVVAVGLADRERRLAMPKSALLHAGSAGKTLFAALALQLVAEGRISLDEKVVPYLAHEPWYARIPNADAITLRMLLNHSSGLPEYGADFMSALIQHPGQRRTPLDAVKSVAGAKPLFRAGTAFSYTDVNYQLLQLVTERITGKPAYAQIRRRLLLPLQLGRIVPADRRLIPGLVQGYAGTDSFMGFDAVMDQRGLKLDPAFEGGGGGFVTNAGDLAHWMGLFMQGKAFAPALLAEVEQGLPAGQLDVGKDARSGLGVELVQTPLGMAYGHGGFFPGYLTLVLWYAEPGIAVALQVNSSAGNALGRPLRDVLLEAARALTAGQGPTPQETRVVSKADEAVRRVAEDWKAAYNSKDAAAVASLYAPDAYYVSAHVVAQGRREIQAYFQRGIDAGGRIDDIRILASSHSGELAYTVGTYEATNGGQKVRGRNVVVLRNIGSKWLMVAHESVVADQP